MNENYIHIEETKNLKDDTVLESLRTSYRKKIWRKFVEDSFP